MQDRLLLEQLNSTIMNQQLEFNKLMVTMVELVEKTKIERSDKLLSAAEVKKKLGINDKAFSQIKKDPTFPKIKLTETGNLKYSDKAVDGWILSRQLNIK